MNQRATITMHCDMLELKHYRQECRFASVLLGLAMFFAMLEPSVLIFYAPETLVARVAGLTHRADWIALFFLQCAALKLPHLWLQIFHPKSRHLRLFSKLACFALCVASAMWMLLAYLSRNMDVFAVTLVFARNSLGAVAFALAIAISLNNQQLRGIESHAT